MSEAGSELLAKFFLGPGVKVCSKLNLPAGVGENTVPPKKKFLLDCRQNRLDRRFQAWPLLVRGSGEQQQIAIRIFDDEIPGAPRLLFQPLVEGDTGGLKLKKQQLDLVRRSDGQRCRQQFLPLAERRLDYRRLDAL